MKITILILFLKIKIIHKKKAMHLLFIIISYKNSDINIFFMLVKIYVNFSSMIEKY